MGNERVEMELVKCSECGRTAEAGDVAGVDMVEIDKKITCLDCLAQELERLAEAAAEELAASVWK